LAPHKMHHLKITTRMTTTAVLTVTLVVAAAATTFMSTPQIAQAITAEEGVELLNQVAEGLERHSSDAADRLRAIAGDLGGHDGGVGCSPWDPRC
jgi:hypothetical protein